MGKLIYPVRGSLPIEIDDRNEPLTIGWGLPEGSEEVGAGYLTFGIDPRPLAKTPSVADAVGQCVEPLSVIPDAKRVPTK